jgi:DNA-binding NtrC family response regulator
VLQDHCIERLGSNLTIPLDVRILAATNCDLEAAVRDGRFREDLYYRLNVVTLQIPPLRQRREDLLELAQFLLRRSAGRMKMQIPSLSEEAKELICNSDWPGNVRELEHCLERALILSKSGMIIREYVEPSSSPSTVDPSDSVSLEDGLRGAVAKLERRLIERALASSGGNRTRAAEILKINRRLLYDKLREYGLE